MEIKPIRTKAAHRAALKEIETLMNAKAGTPEGERLDVLARAVEAYERKALHEQLGIPGELLIREPTAGYRVRRRGMKRS